MHFWSYNKGLIFMKCFALPVVYVVYTRIVISFLRSSDFIIYYAVDGHETPIQYNVITSMNIVKQLIRNEGSTL